MTNARNTFASLIVAAFQTAVRPEQDARKPPLNNNPLPLPEQLQKIAAKDGVTLLKDAEAAIKAKDQVQAAALIHRYGELKLPERPVFDLMLRYACSEDGLCMPRSTIEPPAKSSQRPVRRSVGGNWWLWPA